MNNKYKDTLSIGALKEGFVLDHIKAGMAMTIYRDLKLKSLDCTVAIIKNASRWTSLASSATSTTTSPST